MNDRIIKANIPFLKDRTVLYVDGSKGVSIITCATIGGISSIAWPLR